MKLSKRRSTKRSYRKASPKKRTSYRKRRASPKKRVSPKKRASYRYAARRPRISFRFSNDIDPRSVTDASIDQANNDLSYRLNQLSHRLNPQQKNAAINMMESVGDKYFIDVVSNYNFTNGGDGLYGNDALEFVCDKLDTTPVILVELIPSIGDLSFEELTVKKIKLLLQAYYLRELNDYLDTL